MTTTTRTVWRADPAEEVWTALGTLCRVIPLEQIDGRWIKFRVEAGDVGQCIGVVMVVSPELRVYKAFLNHRTNRYAEPTRLTGKWSHPEAAALELAAAWWERERETASEPG